jgi:hypothetical protein
MVVDDLFTLPLDEFTAARNALAGRLKKAGKTAEAEQVKGLGKPPVSAWAVNQLYWRHRKPFDALMASAEQFRKAQAAQLSGKAGDLRGTLDARREALGELSRLAAAILKESGHTPGPDIMRRVTTTLEALATYGKHPDAPQGGRLTGDVDPPGFEALAALIPHAGDGPARRGDPRVLPFRQSSRKTTAKKPKGETPEATKRREQAERDAARAAAKSAVHGAEKALRAARREAEQAEAALKKAAATAREAEKARAEAEKQLEKASAASDAARLDARRVASAAEEAAQAVADAERELEQAKALLADPHLA